MAHANDLNEECKVLQDQINNTKQAISQLQTIIENIVGELDSLQGEKSEIEKKIVMLKELAEQNAKQTTAEDIVALY